MRPKVRTYFDGHIEEIQINIHQSIASFKKLLQNVTKLPSSEFDLFFFQQPRPIQEITDIRKTLLSLKVDDGDTFYIKRKYLGSGIDKDWEEDMKKQPVPSKMRNRVNREPRIVIKVGKRKVNVGSAPSARVDLKNETEGQRRARLMREEVNLQRKMEQKKKSTTVGSTSVKLTGAMNETEKKNVPVKNTKKFSHVKSSFVRPKKLATCKDEFLEIFVSPRKGETANSLESQMAQDNPNKVNGRKMEQKKKPTKVGSTNVKLTGAMTETEKKNVPVKNTKKFSHVKSSFVRPKKLATCKDEFVEIFVSPRKGETANSLDSQTAQENPNKVNGLEDENVIQVSGIWDNSGNIPVDSSSKKCSKEVSLNQDENSGKTCDKTVENDQSNDEKEKETLSKVEKTDIVDPDSVKIDLKPEV